MIYHKSNRLISVTKSIRIKKNLTNYGDKGFSIFLRKAFIKGLGYSDEMLDKKIIGITNTFSDYNPCHGNVPDLIKSVKTGILSNGAIPLEFPTITIHESFANPTSMYLRNLMSIDTEEMLRAQAVKRAKQQMTGVSHSMMLEEQALTDEGKKVLLEKWVDEILSRSDSKLWDE